MAAQSACEGYAGQSAILDCGTDNLPLTGIDVVLLVAVALLLLSVGFAMRVIAIKR